MHAVEDEASQAKDAADASGLLLAMVLKQHTNVVSQYLQYRSLSSVLRRYRS